MSDISCMDCKRLKEEYSFVIECIRDVHGDGDDGNPADSAGIPRVWKTGMRNSRGNGSQCCGDLAGMEKNARDARGFNLLTSKLLAETVPRPRMTEEICLARILLMEFSFSMD